MYLLVPCPNPPVIPDGCKDSPDEIEVIDLPVGCVTLKCKSTNNKLRTRNRIPVETDEYGVTLNTAPPTTGFPTTTPPTLPAFTGTFFYGDK